MPAATSLGRWAGENVSVGEVERQLAQLRVAATEQDGEPILRTSVMTHMAWVPAEWAPKARKVLAGLGERHPSRTILLVPHPRAQHDGIDATVALERFALEERQICTEVIELRLQGARAHAPASIVTPLLIFDLPVYLRWRGRPHFGAPELEQLVQVADRLVLDSGEWPDPGTAYGALGAYFTRSIVSDIAWARTLPWRRALAGCWPQIAHLSQVVVHGPEAEALLLAGWLRSRLRRPVVLQLREAAVLESVDVDGQHVPAPPRDLRTPSDLLSDELDDDRRDRIYEEAVRAAATEQPPV